MDLHHRVCLRNRGASVLGTLLNIFMTQHVELVHVDKVLLIELIGVFVTYRTFEKYHEVDTK